MRVEFITNAAIVVHLASGRTILVDPWWDGSAFSGSWHNFPPLSDVDRQRYNSLKPDAIFISHSHPDHLHPETLAHFAPTTPILIGQLPHKHLHRSIAALGFQNIQTLEIGAAHEMFGAELTVIADFGFSTDGHADETGYVIDSSLFICDSDGATALHVIDNAIQIEDAHSLRARFGTIDIALLPFAGASFFPHAFFRLTHAQKIQRRDAVTDSRLAHFVQVASILEPKYCIPAAGSYVMGGRIAAYSEMLHQAVPKLIASRFASSNLPNTQLRLMAAGDTLESQTGVHVENPNALFRDYTSAERAQYAIDHLASHALPQDQLVIPSAFTIPWQRLLAKARANQVRKQQQLSVFPNVDVKLTILASPGVSLGNRDELTFNFAFDDCQPASLEAAPERRSIEFRIDASMLLMILNCAAIWDNVEIAALIECAREPDVQDPTLHSLMSYFTL